ncbi:MAG: CBS domain-containing protein [Chloroflexi bacterium]|nr:CBS domain-containing protein [Chloroflexota bacterium]
MMTKKVVTVTPQALMPEIREILLSRHISGVPVVEDGVLVGIISIEDLIKALAKGEMGARVGDKMTPTPTVLNINDPLVLSVDYFTRFGFGRFPVIDKKGQLVGILTQSDVTRGLLKKLEVEYHEGEIRRYRASHIFEDIVSDRTSISLNYDLATRDFDHAGAASRKIKRALSRLGVPSQIVRRAAIATYEAEMNVIIHADERGGLLEVQVQPDKITIKTTDQGPGIPDIELATRPGFSTASEGIREMGFGAGMGLTNIRKCADEMRLESPHSSYTKLEIVIYLQQDHLFSDSLGA